MVDLTAGAPTPHWLGPDGRPVTCVEKLKVLEDNLADLRAQAEDALAEAVLMGCDPEFVRRRFAETVATLVDPYRR
jgi:hypothetical protein